MNDLKIFFWWVFIIFTLSCCLLCVEARIRYRNKKGIDQDQGFSNKYKYFGQPIYNHQQKIQGYELLLREFDSQTQRWQLPSNVNNFPLSKIVHTVQKIDPKIIANIKFLSLNMTVSQISDFRAAYFFKWLLGVINHHQLLIEIDATDLCQANFVQRYRVLKILKQIDHPHIKITIENVDSSKKTYRIIKSYLPYTDFLKFDIHSFKKSSSHWIDITLAQWQRFASKEGTTPIVGKVENADQVALADQLNINLRQGYAYGEPKRI